MNIVAIVANGSFEVKDGYTEVLEYENNKIWIVMIFGQRKRSVRQRLCRDCERSGWFRMGSCEVWLIVACVQ